VTVGDRVLIGGGWSSDPTTRRLVYDDLVHIYDGRTGAWSEGKLSVARGQPVGVTVGDLALFVGGRTLGDADHPGEQGSDAVDIYDSTNDSWSVAHLSFADRSPRIVRVGRQVMVAASPGPNEGKIDAFDVATRSFRPTTWTPIPREGDSITAHGIRLITKQSPGRGVWDITEPLDLHDTEHDEWSTLSLPTPRRRVGVAAAGPFVIFAGGEVDGTPLDTVEDYDTRSAGWSSAKLSAPRISVPSLTIGQRVLFFGDTIDVFDGTAGTWSTTTPPVPLKGEPTVRGTVAVWSLFVPPYEPDSERTVVIYDSVSNTWHTGTLSVPRSNYSVATAGSRVLFAGGAQIGVAERRTPKVELTVVDIYDLATGTWSQGQLQKGRETMTTATVADKALFIGGILGCNSCPIGNVGLIVDIYDASAD
jgi:hypothetical protein